jgi:hypothetical protein
MSPIEYAPGAGFLLASDRLAVLVDTKDSDLVETLWAVVARGGSEVDVIDVLTAGGIAHMPDFGCVVWSGSSARVLLRGSLTARIRSGNVEQVADSGGVATWSERVVNSHSGTVLSIGAAPDRTLVLPLVCGVVQASAVFAGDWSRVQDEPARAELVPEIVSEPQVDLVPEPVPAVSGVEPALVVVAPQPAAEPESSPPKDSRETQFDAVSDSFDAWFGDTVARTPEDAAVREEPVAAPILITGPPTPIDGSSKGVGDHDGMTVARGNRPGLVAPRVISTAPSSGPSGRLRISDGQVIELGTGVFVGRAPRARNSSDGTLPRLVTVASPNNDISRTHAEFNVEGGDVLVADVSSNGTILTRPGKPPERLPAGRKTVVHSGSSVDLGDGIVIVVELDGKA